MKRLGDFAARIDRSIQASSDSAEGCQGDSCDCRSLPPRGCGIVEQELLDEKGRVSGS